MNNFLKISGIRSLIVSLVCTMQGKLIEATYFVSLSCLNSIFIAINEIKDKIDQK